MVRKLGAYHCTARCDRFQIMWRKRTIFYCRTWKFGSIVHMKKRSAQNGVDELGSKC